MSTLALNNVRPYGEDIKHVLIDGDGLISAIADTPFDEDVAETVIDGGGNVLLPGLAAG